MLDNMLDYVYRTDIRLNFNQKDSIFHNYSNIYVIVLIMKQKHNYQKFIFMVQVINNESQLITFKISENRKYSLKTKHHFVLLSKLFSNRFNSNHFN
jgi:hypothetical protein